MINALMHAVKIRKVAGGNHKLASKLSASTLPPINVVITQNSSCAVDESENRLSTLFANQPASAPVSNDVTRLTMISLG